MMNGILVRVLLLLSVAFSAAGHADERILDYLADIEVLSDGSMLVEETIEVRAAGERIRRGIYRDFPTDYTDRLGNRYRVAFEVLEVRRDGRAEPYHTERQSNGVRVYVGDADVFLKPGEYRYSLRYRTDRQLGFFDTHDELYWNVTGNGWEFHIDKAAARVVLPAGVPVGEIRVEGYTGPMGARGQDYRAAVDARGRAVFETTRSLPPGHGLTLVASWPKGYVEQPDRSRRIAWFFADNRILLVALGGFFLLFGYYIVVWQRVGRDPELGVVVPLYAPPQGYSPASMRFVSRMGYDHQTFGAAVVDMAVKGYLRIEEDDKGVFSLEKTGEKVELAPGEGAIAHALFGAGDRIELKRVNHRRLSRALEAHKASLKRDYEKTYFVTNGGYIIPGLVITLAFLGSALLAADSEETLAVGGFMMVWLSIWSIAVFKMLANVGHLWRDARGSGFGSYAKAIGSSLFAVPFVVGELVGIGVLMFAVSFTYTLILLAAVGVNLAFYEWLKAPTLAGQRLRREVEGFKQYLSVAEKDELDYRHPVEKTPALFEAYLPHALALDVGQQWAERFSGVLATAGRDGEDYRPRWYHGRSWNSRNLTGFAGAMGTAMGSAIASASTAPGSSSGSGGGGSSGGGGGGGGGGGW